MWERGRARLQNYLKEIGWTETIIDVRSKCTRNLLKLGNAEQEENINPNVNGTETNNKRASESQGMSSSQQSSEYDNESNFYIIGRDQPAKKSQQAMADALLLDTEAAVMSSFAFLEPADVEMDEEDYMGDDMDLVTSSDADIKQLKLKTKGVIVNDGKAFSIHSTCL